jgi:hypothetical protein
VSPQKNHPSWQRKQDFTFNANGDTSPARRLDGLPCTHIKILALEAAGEIPRNIIDEFRRSKAEILNLLRPVPHLEAARFSDLYENEADYARALIRYARHDGLGLTIKDARLVISIGSKSDTDLLGKLRAHEYAVIEALGAKEFCPPR